MRREGEIERAYANGEKIAVQGEVGDCMFVIRNGTAEVLLARPDKEIRLAILEQGDVFGEMSLFAKEPRPATLRALGEVTVLRIDKRGFLRRVHEDPTLAFRVLQKMSLRIRALTEELARLKEPRTVNASA